ncbi:hypothetical protein [Emcibacter sp.]|uniref:hypothetical protein n=1 Tax=Emcibacter sp. TaxID=1979954 RepID=UPI002AA65510|nr:hypothetical protein [Emcibacter sp.]
MFCLAAWTGLLLYALYWNIPQAWCGYGLHPLTVLFFWIFLAAYIPLFLLGLALHPYKRMIELSWAIPVLFLAAIFLIGPEAIHHPRLCRELWV